MRGTAYARIFYPWGEKDPSKRRIYVGERTWDGIDRPDYSDQFNLTPAEARYLGQELLKLAEQIDGKSKKDRTHAKIVKVVQSIIKEEKKALDL